jgi:hypothetical protein
MVSPKPWSISWTAKRGNECCLRLSWFRLTPPRGRISRAGAEHLIHRLRDRSPSSEPTPTKRDLAAHSRQLLEIFKELQATDAGSEDDQVGQAAANPDEPRQAL